MQITFIFQKLEILHSYSQVISYHPDIMTRGTNLAYLLDKYIVKQQYDIWKQYQTIALGLMCSKLPYGQYDFKKASAIKMQFLYLQFKHPDI